MGADYDLLQECVLSWRQDAVRHPKGDVVIDGGNAKEVSEDKHAHWGNVVAAYDPVMGKTENCIDQLNSIGINPL